MRQIRKDAFKNLEYILQHQRTQGPLRMRLAAVDFRLMKMAGKGGPAQKIEEVNTPVHQRHQESNPI